MPYRSDAQRRKFYAMLARGDINEKVVDEFDRSSKGVVLPERVHTRPTLGHKGAGNSARKTAKGGRYKKSW